MWIKKSMARTGWRVGATVLSLAALNDHTAFFLDFCLPYQPQHPSSEGPCSLSFLP